MPIEDIFRTFPRLETERLVLRQIRASDADALFAFYSDAEVVDDSTKRHHSLEETRTFLQQLQRWYQTQQNVQWGITRKGDDLLLGTCGFYAFDEGFHRADVGYELLKTCWRQGIMSEALSAILTFAFTVMDLQRIDAVVIEGNERSQGILRKLGFVHEGILRKRRLFGTQFRDEYRFGLLRDDPRGFV